MKDLFHGITYDILEIDITQGKGYKDFGKGFYATAVKSHAESIARRNKRRLEVRETSLKRRNPKYKEKKYQAYRYNLEFDDTCLEGSTGLKLKQQIKNGYVLFCRIEIQIVVHIIMIL